MSRGGYLGREENIVEKKRASAGVVRMTEGVVVERVIPRQWRNVAVTRRALPMCCLYLNSWQSEVFRRAGFRSRGEVKLSWIGNKGWESRGRCGSPAATAGVPVFILEFVVELNIISGSAVCSVLGINRIHK